MENRISPPRAEDVDRVDRRGCVRHVQVLNPELDARQVSYWIAGGVEQQRGADVFRFAVGTQREKRGVFLEAVDAARRHDGRTERRSPDRAVDTATCDRVAAAWV